MGAAVRAHVREMPTRDLDLVRDSVQGEKRAERRLMELSGVFPLHKNRMSGAKFADIMIPNILPKFLKLTSEILLGFSPVNSATTARSRVPR
jgi:hypothetical protein